jgi:queuine/archaeosine tRNA-ribosyltransferase
MVLAALVAKFMENDDIRTAIEEKKFEEFAKKFIIVEEVEDEK